MIGQRYEHRHAEDGHVPRCTERSRFTGDTVLTLAIAQAIPHGRDDLNLMSACARRDPHAGYGGDLRGRVHPDSPEPYNSLGNGLGMRVSPVVWACHPAEQILQEAEGSAVVRHNHPERIRGAQAVVAPSILRARTGARKEEIQAEIAEWFGCNLSRPPAEIAPTCRWSVTCHDSVPEPIIAFPESTNFKSSARSAIMPGGDADTMAAIAGSIAAACYGMVPAPTAGEVQNRLPLELRSVVEESGREFGARARRDL